jgi:hypothetical protein
MNVPVKTTIRVFLFRSFSHFSRAKGNGFKAFRTLIRSLDRRQSDLVRQEVKIQPIFRDRIRLIARRQKLNEAIGLSQLDRRLEHQER